MAKKKLAPGEWTYPFGDAPVRVTAYERADRGFRIFTRTWDGKKYSDKRFLCESIRDEHGQIVPALETAARNLTEARQKTLKADLPADYVGPLTLAAGFARFLDPQAGKYAGDSRWKGDVTRNAETVLDALGRDTLWSDIRHADYRKLWRHLATEHVRDGSYGPRVAEMIVGVLLTATRWLQREGLLEPGTALLAPNWKQSLKEEWASITKRPVLQPKQPRYSPDELTRIWKALPEGDPRVALALEIGAELRLGQIPRSRRTDILKHGEHEVGAVRVHGRGKKLGELIILTDQQRAAIEQALTEGYLSDLEAAYKAGELADFHLLPGKYLAKGKAQLKNAMIPLERTAMRKHWSELETKARVKHVKGRNWYGVRRLQADRAEDVESDARVLNKLGAWKHTHTREHYQEAGRTDILEKAAATRGKIRPQSG